MLTRRNSRRFFAGLLVPAGIIVLCLFQPRPAESRIYEWVDAAGTTHFTDDLNSVPPRYRGKYSGDPEADAPTPPSKPVEQPKPGNETSTAPVAPTNPSMPSASKSDTPNPSPTAAPNTSSGAKDENYWRNRAAETESKLQEARSDLEKIYTDRRKNLESGPGMQARQADLAKRESEATAKIAALEKQLNETLPDEARKAGAPPGWLRREN